MLLLVTMLLLDRTCRDWFKRFREGDISLEDRPRSGCPMESDIERLKVLIEDNPRLTTRELSTMLGCNQSTIDRHLHEMGKVNKLGNMGSTSTYVRQHTAKN